LEPRYFARSASDRTDDWPFWFVADRKLGGPNRTAEITDLLFPGKRTPGSTLTDRETAQFLAEKANADG
jgi:hypothetical protein